MWQGWQGRGGAGPARAGRRSVGQQACHPARRRRSSRVAIQPLALSLSLLQSIKKIPAHLGHEDQRLVDIVINDGRSRARHLRVRHLRRRAAAAAALLGTAAAGVQARIGSQAHPEPGAAAPPHLDVKGAALLALAARDERHPHALGGPLGRCQRLAAAGGRGMQGQRSAVCGRQWEVGRMLGGRLQTCSTKLGAPTFPSPRTRPRDQRPPVAQRRRWAGSRAQSRLAARGTQESGCPSGGWEGRQAGREREALECGRRCGRTGGAAWSLGLAACVTTLATALSLPGPARPPWRHGCERASPGSSAPSSAGQQGRC